MKNKERFILDDGEIRNCPSNIAKMTPLEFTWWKLLTSWFGLKILWEHICGLIELAPEMLNWFGWLFIILVQILLYPIWIVLVLVVGYKIAKKEVANETRR